MGTAVPRALSGNPWRSWAEIPFECMGSGKKLNITHTAPDFQRVYNRRKLSRNLFIGELLFGILSRLYCCRNIDISYLSWNSTPQATIVILLPPALIID